MRVNLLEELGSIYYKIGNYGQADQCFRSAFKSAQQIPLTAEQLAHLCEEISDVCEYEGRYSDVKQFVQLGRKFLSDGKVPSPNQIQMDLDQDEIFMQMRAGQNKQAIQSFKQLLDDAQRLPLTHRREELVASIYNGLAIAYSSIGQFRKALDAYQNAADIAELVGNKTFKATCLLNIADEYFRLGDLDQSQTYVETALTFARQIGDLEDVAYAQASRGEILLARGRPQEAIREIEEAIAEFERLGSMWNMPYMYADLGMAYMAQSNLSTAYRHAQRALSYAKDTDSQFETGIALAALACVEVAKNEWTEAERHFKQAIAIHRKSSHYHFEGRVRRDFAEALLQRGEKIKADKLIRQALRIFRKLGMANEIAKTEVLLEAEGAITRQRLNLEVY